MGALSLHLVHFFGAHWIKHQSMQWCERATLGTYIRWSIDVPPPTDVRLGQCMCHRARSQKRHSLAATMAVRCSGLHVGVSTLTPPQCWRRWWELSCWRFILSLLLLSERISVIFWWKGVLKEVIYPLGFLSGRFYISNCVVCTPIVTCQTGCALPNVTNGPHLFLN